MCELPGLHLERRLQAHAERQAEGLRGVVSSGASRRGSVSWRGARRRFDGQEFGFFAQVSGVLSRADERFSAHIAWQWARFSVNCKAYA